MTSERLHRYAVIARYAAGKRVLVVGERDPALVASLRMRAADVSTIALNPFELATRFAHDDASFDIVIAFAGLDRLSDASGLVREARRVLGGRGMFCAAFPAGGGGAWSLDAVRALVAEQFAASTVYAQRHIAGSFFDPVGTDGAAQPEWYVRDASGLRGEPAFESAPAAYVALCAPSGTPPAVRSTLFDEVESAPVAEASALRAAADENTEELRETVARLRSELAMRERQVEGFTANADRSWRALNHVQHVAHEREEALVIERKALQNAVHRIASLEDTLRAIEAASGAQTAQFAATLAQHEAAVAERDAALLDRDAALRDRDAALAAVTARLEDAERRAAADGGALRELLASQSWRMTEPVRRMMKTLRGNRAGET